MTHPFRFKIERSHFTGNRRRFSPSCERLEAVCLLSTASPVISGSVFVDKNNDGIFETGESPASGTKLQLLNASGTVVGAALTGSNGAYAFATNATVGSATQSISQTLTLPADSTNLDSAYFANALQLFDPTLGTLVGVQISSVVTVATTLGGENLSSSTGADISGSVSGTDEIDGLSVPISGTVSASSTTFHASTYDGSLDDAGPSGVAFPLNPTDAQSVTLSGASDLAFYTAGPGRTSITPTATIQASIQVGSTSGNVFYSASTTGAAVVTVTYQYTPTNALQPGAYTIVPVPPSGFAEGMATSQTGQVVTTPSGGREIVVNLTSSGSSQNNFGLLPGIKALSVTAPKHVTTTTPKPVVVTPSVRKAVGHKVTVPVTKHPTVPITSSTRTRFARN